MVKISVPGSKSESNRVLALAALSDTSVKIKNLLECDDTNAMISALRKLGVSIEISDSEVTVFGRNGTFEIPETPLEVGNAGTTTRFLLGLTCLARGPVRMHGNEYMALRPNDPLISALNELGATVEKINEPDGTITFVVDGSGFKSDTVELPGNISSQFITALLLLGTKSGGMNIKIIGELLSKPYLDLSLSVMKRFGIDAGYKHENEVYVTDTSSISSPPYTVFGDASSVSYWFLWSELHQVSVTVNLSHECGQGDIRLVDILKQMGADYCETANELQYAPASELHVFDGDVSDIPDVVPTLATICAVKTNGVSLLRNVGHLRFKECDRIEAILKNFALLGLQAEIVKENEQEHLKIYGNIGSMSGTIQTYDDHRIAMVFGTLSSKYPGIQIDNPDCVSKSYPTFWKQLDNLSL